VLFLRRQLALYVERGMKPRRIDAATRVSLALLSRLFQWRSALVVVGPQTLIRWHRAGCRLFWRVKSLQGRPPIPLELRGLIRRMALENPLWAQERIANELLVELGIHLGMTGWPRRTEDRVCYEHDERVHGDLLDSPRVAGQEIHRGRLTRGPHSSCGKHLPTWNEG